MPKYGQTLALTSESEKCVIWRIQNTGSTEYSKVTHLFRDARFKKFNASESTSESETECIHFKHLIGGAKLIQCL